MVDLTPLILPCSWHSRDDTVEHLVGTQANAPRVESVRMQVTSFAPAYVRLLESGALAARVAAAASRLEDCDLCARYCRINRRVTIAGAVCRTGERAIVHGYGPHHGEEDCLRGSRGSGTIFFSLCNLRCVYCQNWEISQASDGDEVSAEQLAAMMLALQARGCHNINFVSPSHVVAQIIAATELAARRYSKVRHYVAVNQAAVTEMHRQVGDLVVDEEGIALRGLLVRHLVLPEDCAGTAQVMASLARLSRETYVNIMDQYHPCYRADEYPPLDRRVSASEYQAAVQSARDCGLTRLDRRSRIAWFSD